MRGFNFAILSMILAQSAQAEIWSCNALCISVDSTQSVLYILSDEDVIRNGRSSDVFRYLKKKCTTLAAEQVGGVGILVSDLAFQASFDQESESSSSSWESSQQSDQSGAETTYERSRSRKNRTYREYYSNFSISDYRQFSSFSSSSRERLQRSLDIGINRAREVDACQLEVGMNDYDIPYQGGLNVQ